VETIRNAIITLSAAITNDRQRNALSEALEKATSGFVKTMAIEAVPVTSHVAGTGTNAPVITQLTSAAASPRLAQWRPYRGISLADRFKGAGRRRVRANPVGGVG
jgi:hypothetical protein